MANERATTTRRDFLQKMSLLTAAPLILSACGGGEGGAEADSFACTDVSGLSQDAIDMRQRVEYVDESPIPDQLCNNCQHYQVAATEGTCGGCAVLQGPIHPEGYCTLWVAQQA